MPIQIVESQVTGLVSDLAGKEPLIGTKLTAFNKNFGTITGTVAEGNDSRILNGQSAFSWGNHASKYPLFDGTGAYGSWAININGDARNLYGNISETSENPSAFKLNSIRYFVNAPGAPASYFQALTIGNGGDFTQIGVGSDGALNFRFGPGNWKKVWHNENFNPANYLPLTGGTLSGNLAVGDIYTSSNNNNTIPLNNAGWVKLCTVVDNSIVKIVGKLNSSTSEETFTIDINTTYYADGSLITATRKTYNPLLQEIRVEGTAHGVDKAIYVKVKTTEYASTINWNVVNSKGIVSINNTITTPVATLYNTLIVGDNTSFSTNANTFQSGAATFSSTVTASSFSGSGTGLTGTANGLSIGGNAGSATNWGSGANQTYQDLDNGNSNAIMVTSGGTGIWKNRPIASFKTDLGLGSNAYNSTAFLPLTGGTMTGSLILKGNGTSGFYNGTGDDATYLNQNFVLQGWNGLGLHNPTTGGAFPNQTVGYFDFRNGFLDMLGGFKVNNQPVLHSGNYSSYAVPLTQPVPFDYTSGFTVSISLRGYLLIHNSPSAGTITIPSIGNIGDRFDFMQKGTGQLTIGAGAGVTLVGSSGFLARVQYSVISAIKISTTEWLIIGDTKL